MYTRIRLCHNHHPETAGEDGDYLVVRASDGEDSFPQAGLHPDREPGAGWKDGLPLTDRADAARTREESRGVADAQAEMLLAIAFSKLMFGNQNGEGSCIHVPSHMRRWDARIDDVSSADHDQFLAANREALAVAMADHARRETPSHMTVFDDRPLHEPSEGYDSAGDEPVIELREARIGEGRAPCHAVTLRRSAKLGIRECVEAIDRFAELAGTNGGRLGDRRRRRSRQEKPPRERRCCSDTRRRGPPGTCTQGAGATPRSEPARPSRTRWAVPSAATQAEHEPDVHGAAVVETRTVSTRRRDPTRGSARVPRQRKQSGHARATLVARTMPRTAWSGAGERADEKWTTSTPTAGAATRTAQDPYTRTPGKSGRAQQPRGVDRRRRQG